MNGEQIRTASPAVGGQSRRRRAERHNCGRLEDAGVVVAVVELLVHVHAFAGEEVP